MDITRSEKRRRVERVSAACDLCKTRKVKCDGQLPCSYCTRKGRSDSCRFSGPKPRQTQSANNTPRRSSIINATDGTTPRIPRNAANDDHAIQPETHHTELRPSTSPAISKDDHYEGTVVPLEARLLRDAQGKVIFIGDCAPISFLQTVRHLVASETDQDGFLAQATKDSFIEVAPPETIGASRRLDSRVRLDEVEALVTEYYVATSGLVHLSDSTQLLEDIKRWAAGTPSHVNDALAAVYYLVLAIGVQENDEPKAETWFKHARDLLLTKLTDSMNVATVQGFALIAVYMMRAFQPNGAYLYFSLAARTAYAIGLHRTVVNASFGAGTHTMRDRLWKSLRAVDMLISTMLGRPPSTSDVDCTVKYKSASNNETLDVLDASVQVFMIIERVVVEVYSRKRISLRIANFVSHQLKSWASHWLRSLTDVATGSVTESHTREVVVGACQVLCSYYYGIMLLTRPFLIYEVYEYLGTSRKASATRADYEEKAKFADAALDAAVAFVDTLQSVIDTGKMPRRMPLVVSWLFTTSLVLAVGVLGRSGLSFEENCKASTRCLEYFAQVDPHARQYVLIVQTLLRTTTERARKRELDLRSQRKQASSQLFGLIPPETSRRASSPVSLRRAGTGEPSLSAAAPEQDQEPSDAGFDWNMYDADFFALPWQNENDEGLQDFLQPGRHTIDGSSADIPLFPMYDLNGVSSI